MNSKDDYHRICGTSIGGSLYWGILRLLNQTDPTEALTTALHGDSSHLDMTVGDIYGGDYSKMALPANLIASSFGKMKDMNAEEISEVKIEVRLSLG